MLDSQKYYLNRIILRICSEINFMKSVNSHNENQQYSQVKKRRRESCDNLKKLTTRREYTPSTIINSTGKDYISLTIQPLEVITEQPKREVITPIELRTGSNTLRSITNPAWTTSVELYNRTEAENTKYTQTALSSEWGYFFDPENGKKIVRITN